MSQSNIPTSSLLPRRRKTFPTILFRHLLTLLLLSIALAGQAQPVARASAVTQETPTTEQIQERIDALKNTSGIDEELRKQLLELYQVTLERLMAAKGYAATTQELEQLVQQAPEQIRRLQRQAQHVELPASPTQTGLINADLGRIQQVLAQEKAALAGLQSQLTELEEQLRQAQARPTRAREELATAKLRRQEIERSLQTTATTSENERLQQARLASQQAARLAVTGQIRALEQELLSNDSRIALLTAQRDLARQRLNTQAQKVRELDELANQHSLTEAAQSAQQAAQAAVGAQPVVKEAAAVNAALSDQLAQLVAQLEGAAADQQRLQQQLDQLQARYRTTEQQLDIAGLSQALGDVLRRERHSMPPVSQVAKRVDERQQRIADLRLRQFQLEQEGQAAETIDRQIVGLLAEQLPRPEPAQTPQITQRLQQLLADRADLRQKVAINYSRYADQLLELNRIEQQLAAQTVAYQDLLDENLFWIASSRLVDFHWAVNVGRSLVWLVDPGQWAAVAGTLGQRLAVAPLASGALVLVGTLLVFGQSRLRRRLAAAAEPVGTERDHILLTVQALCYTLLLALPWPFFSGTAGTLLVQNAASGSFAQGVGAGLRNTALVVLIIEGFRQLCRDHGVAQVHFRWRQASRRILRQQLSWLLAVAVPVSFLITLTETQADELHRDSLGRLAFTIGSIALAIFAWRVLRPRFRLARAGTRERRRGWWRIRRLLRVAMTALPLGLAALALYGYYYTALQLESRFITTGWLLVGLMIVGNLLLRWIRLAEQQLLAIPARPGRGAGKTRAELNLATADEQIRTLFTVAVTVITLMGVWLIWSDLLPAFNILEGVVLWESTGGAGAPLIQVTVGDLALAVVVIGFTLIAARNLPGVLEIAVLHRLAVDPGNRYAITTISRYLIVAIGLLIAISLLGVRWSQAQWLIAALGVGLGFGLQEIFANFISGLILLFERPIRVGDAVTVNDMSGRVTRIQIRATTITDWDRRELIIPNKTFITDRLINWTLTDSVTRIKIKLRTPYGSSPDQVRRILLDCAAAHPRVMRDPEPFAYVVGVSDSALEFELCVFVKEIGDRLPTRHALYANAVRKLAEQGIGIPFPQRDLHIRSIAGPDQAEEPRA
ncbi:MAG TPA: mechanosensitive ion channel domain-containing protein [Gammaproteobacteria bacterium]|nr:mechanosensitive ion channel domain-containing protein [Gammaproteobacteria bacterium]